jgi:hypothetical protein
MSFIFKPGRAVRLCLLLGALMALPLAVAGTAQASMAGAPPETSNLRPDLRSLHILTGINAGRTQFCFDKPLAGPSPTSGDDFELGGYRWDTFLVGTGGAVLDSTGDCAIVLMQPNNNGMVADLAQYTFGSDYHGAVTANVSGGQPNIGDSTPNLDSTSNNGTAGHTTGLDLEGVTLGAPAGTNEIIYTFDQNVDCTTIANFGLWMNFLYYNAAGTTRFGAAMTGCSGPNVRIAFSVPTVSDAVVATTNGCYNNVSGCPFTPGYNDTPNPETQVPLLSVTVPGTSGVSALPDVVSTALAGSNQIDYTFDKFISAAIPSDFLAYASNGDQTRGVTATVLSDGKTVRVTFSSPNVSGYQEELVVGGAGFGAVTGSNGLFNQSGGKPVGDNAGALGTGYTNGPDAQSTTFDNSTGQVQVNFDQRVVANAAGQPVDQGGSTPTVLGNWILLDANGNPVATPTSATVVSTGPFKSAVVLTFADPALVGASTAIELCGNQFRSDNAYPSNPFVEWAGATSDPTCANQGSQIPGTNQTGLGASVVFTSGETGVSGMVPAGNVQQILAPTTSGATWNGHRMVIRMRRVYISLRHHHNRKHHKR